MNQNSRTGVNPNTPTPDQAHFDNIESRIQAACENSKRPRSSVTLIGASKQQESEKVERFVGFGLQSVGENYLQEAIEKQQRLSHLKLDWHFIGHIQSNKTKLVAEHFSWVHGVDRLKIARRLGEQNPSDQAINILLQVNLDAEDSKNGAAVCDAPELADSIAQLEGVNLRGLMAIPRPRESTSEQRACFAKAYELRETINQRYKLGLDHLSMGMSNDLEAAIAEGSTMVRIGTALFGPRPAKAHQ